MDATQPPEILGLLSDPLRWQVVVELGRSDRRVGELVQLVGKPQNLVSYHLAELRQAGIVRARRSSADGRDVYYSADLFRCRDLLDEAGRSLHPGLSLVSTQPAGAAPQRPRPRSAVPLHRQQRALPDRRSRHGAPIGWRRRGTQRGESSQAAASERVRVMAERGIDISSRPTKSLTRFTRSRFDRVITLCDKVREICPEFPGPPIAADWSIADPAAAGDSDQMTYPAFEHVADEINDRVALLLADVQGRPLERTHHG